MRLFAVITLLFVSTAASAVPVQLETVLWVFRPDYAITTNLSTFEGYGAGDCYNCWNYDHLLLDTRRDTEFGEVISRSEATWQSTHTSAHNFMAYGAVATLDVFAQVPRGSSGGAYAQVALSHLMLGFEVLEPVLYTGTTGLTVEQPVLDTYSVRPPLPIVSGSILQPGLYFTSVGYDPIGTVFPSTFWLTQGKLTAHQELYFDYRFTSVPAPPTFLMVGSLLLGIGAVKKRRVAQRNSVASA